MREHDKVRVFDIYTAIKLSDINKELFTITIINLEFDW